jgi:hypothetical protein
MESEFVPKNEKEFEDLIERLLRDKYPWASVTVRKKLVEPDVGEREFDVVVEPKSAERSALILVECKFYQDPLEIGLVEAFITKARDNGASLAIMVSKSGFQRGARKKAEKHGITLLNFRQAQEVDWEHVLGEPLKFAIVITEVARLPIELVLENGTRLRMDDPKVELFDRDASKSSFVGTVEEKVLVPAWKRMALEPIVGQFDTEVRPKEPLFLFWERSLRRLVAVRMRLDFIREVYWTPVVIKDGALLSAVGMGNELWFQQYATEHIDWKEWVETHEPAKLTPDEVKVVFAAGTKVVLEELAPEKPLIRAIFYADAKDPPS